MEILKNEINERFLPVELFDFENKKNIIIQSQTGTGKTSGFMKSIKKSKLKFISIVAKRSLGKQHYNDYIKYVNDNKQIDPVEEIFFGKDIGIDYYTEKHFDTERNLVFCINSLPKLYKRFNHDELSLYDFMKDRVLFIDEIMIFLQTELTKNDTIDSNLKEIYSMLMKMIRFAKCIYFCQSHIDIDLIQTILSQRTGKIHLTVNKYEVMKQKKALKFTEESEFIDRITSEGSNGFLVGCDSKNVADTIYKVCMKSFPDRNIFLITSETSYNEYKPECGDIVIYSPSITYGVDFSFENKQNQYIYIKNNNTINAMQIYQQAMRTRNLNQLKYYIAKEKENKRKYKDYEDCKNKIVKNIENHKQFLNLCTYTNENEDLKVVENCFFKLYVNSELSYDIVSQDLLKSFEELLVQNGFEIETTEDKNDNKMFADAKCEIKIEDKSLIEKFFEKFEELIDERDEEEKEKDKDKKENGEDMINEISAIRNKTEKWLSRCKKFNITKTKDLKYYEDYIFNDYKLHQYYNFISFARAGNSKKSIQSDIEKSFECKVLNEESKNKKILILREIMNIFNIDLYNLNKDVHKEIIITESIKDIINSCNPKNHKKEINYNTQYDIVKFVINKMKHFFGDKFITSIQGGADRKYKYYVNYEMIDKYFDLYANDGKTNINSIRNSILEPWLLRFIK